MQEDSEITDHRVLHPDFHFDAIPTILVAQTQQVPLSSVSSEGIRFSCWQSGSWRGPGVATTAHWLPTLFFFFFFFALMEMEKNETLNKLAED